MQLNHDASTCCTEPKPFVPTPRRMASKPDCHLAKSTRVHWLGREGSVALCSWSLQIGEVSPLNPQGRMLDALGVEPPNPMLLSMLAQDKHMWSCFAEVKGKSGFSFEKAVLLEEDVGFAASSATRFHGQQSLGTRVLVDMECSSEDSGAAPVPCNSVARPGRTCSPTGSTSAGAGAVCETRARIKRSYLCICKRTTGRDLDGTPPRNIPPCAAPHSTTQHNTAQHCTAP